MATVFSSTYLVYVVVMVTTILGAEYLGKRLYKRVGSTVSGVHVWLSFLCFVLAGIPIYAVLHAQGMEEELVLLWTRLVGQLSTFVFARHFVLDIPVSFKQFVLNISKPVSNSFFLQSIGIGLFAILFSGSWIALLEMLGYAHQSQSLVEALQQSAGVKLWLSIVVITVVAPIAEETLFRGMLLSWLHKHKRLPVVPSIFCTGCIFGLFHYDSLTSVPPLIVFGCLLTWLQIRSENLLYPMLAHFINNVLVVFLLLGLF